VKTEVYCSFCSLPHRVYSQKHVSAFGLASFALISVVVSYLAWQEFRWLACVLFLALSAWSEFVHSMRWRQSVNCKNCGFDPFVYKQNPDNAAKMVNEFMALRRDNPSYLLKPRPIIKPIIKRVDHHGKPVRQKDFDALN
jgi:hypothetical protein